jgi:molecular chaperone GrpE
MNSENKNSKATDPQEEGEESRLNQENTHDDYADSYDDTEDRIAELESEIAQFKDQLLRAKAETENVRRRLEQQAEDRGKYAINKFAEDVLPVADNLRRALENIPAEALAADNFSKKLVEGVEMTERALLTMLERYGIKKIETIGHKFDANFHQAMMEIEDSTKPVGTVIYEMQSGYMIHGRLLRAAMVGVSKASTQSPEGHEPIDTQA